MVIKGWKIACAKSYDDRGRRFKLSLDLELGSGSFTAVMGPSGAGKTTLLRLLAGLEKPDSGSVVAGDITWAGAQSFVPTQKRHIGYVFQDYALFPHMSVRQNILYGFREGVDNAWYQHLLAVFQIETLEKDKPFSLSGGQTQRVALARALAGKPSLLLLDEPMAALDFGLRGQVRKELKQIADELGLTVLLVTHDVLEAATLAQRVIWLEAGQVVKEGLPAVVLKSELQQLKEQATHFLG